MYFYGPKGRNKVYAFLKIVSVLTSAPCKIKKKQKKLLTQVLAHS